MTQQEATDAIELWLNWHAVSIAPIRFAKELEGNHFLITMLQTIPCMVKRVFEVIPLDIADCYEVREIAA